MRTVRIFALLMATAALVGCAEEPKTWVNQDRVEVHQDHFTDSFETAKLDDGMLRAIGVYYYRYGNGPMDVVVSYDPRSKVNTAAKAQAEMLRIETSLEGWRGQRSSDYQNGGGGKRGCFYNYGQF
jgi:hypothetical protein